MIRIAFLVLLFMQVLMAAGVNTHRSSVTDNQGNIWIGSWEGLARYDGKTYKYYNSREGGLNAPPKRIEAMVADGNEKIWIKTADHKLYVFYPDLEKFKLIADELKPYSPDIQVIKIQQGPGGSVLLLTRAKNLIMAGTARKNKVKLHTLIDAKDDTDPQTMQLKHDIERKVGPYTCFVGKDFTIWCRTDSTTATDTDKPAARQLFRLISLPTTSTGVRAIYQNSDGDVWVGSRDANLYVYGEDGVMKDVMKYDGQPMGHVYHIMTDSKGRKWLSTKGEGLVVIDTTGTMRRYKASTADKNSISGDKVYMAFEDSKHHIWVCTYDGGLNLVNEEQGALRFINKNNSFLQYPQYGQYLRMRAVAECEGRLWAATADGMMSWPVEFANTDHIPFETYHRNDFSPLASGDVTVLFSDKKKHLWAAAYGAGAGVMTKYDNDSHQPLFKVVTSEKDSLDDNIIGFTDDAQGRMWLISENAFFCYDNQQLLRFDKTTGMLGLDFEEASVLCLRDSSLWAGCKEGVVIFNPDAAIAAVTAQRPARIWQKALNFIKSRGFINLLLMILIVGVVWFLYQRRQKNIENEYVAASKENGTAEKVSSEKISAEKVSSEKVSSGEVSTEDATALASASSGASAAVSDNSNENAGDAVSASVMIPASDGISLEESRSNFQRLQEEKDAKFIESINKAIDEHLEDEDFTLDTVAAQLGSSRSAVFKRMKTLTGYSPVEYLRHYRLNRAVELMKTTDMSISEIAYHSGFKDVGYFGKCFRKQFDKSPREFLSEIRGNGSKSEENIEKG